jgi:hypothetical protein
MRKLTVLPLTALLFSTLALAESWTGTVVDIACAKKDLASHTRTCAISCARTGYGLVTADGTLRKFDEKGNTKALAALKESTKDKDLKATVTGKIAGDTIEVESISF